MDRLYLMSTFVAVVDCQGFAGAARKLDLSPPAVTRAVAALENRLGVQLLTRTTRVVRVTDAGAAYAEDCRRILAEVEEADAAASGARHNAKGHLTITAPVLFGRLRVAPVVTAYLRAHPEVTASCWFIDRVVHMVDEGVDVAVRIGHLPDSSLHAYPIGSDQFLDVAAVTGRAVPLARTLAWAVFELPQGQFNVFTGVTVGNDVGPGYGIGLIPS